MNNGVKSRNEAITLVAMVITIIIIILLAGIAIASLGGENGLIAKVMQSKEKYAISEAKEQLELEITNLQIEQEGKGEELKKEDLPKINSEKIDVRDTTNFPVEVIYEKYKFEVDENFKVTYIGEANETIVTYTTEPEGYTNKDEVKILIKISNPKGIKSIQKPDEDDKILPQQQTTVGIDYTVTKNGHYIFKIVDMDNNEIEKDIYIDLIDRLEPLDFTISASKNDGKIIIAGEAQDAEGDEEGNNTKSGIDYYEYCFVDSNNNITKYKEREVPTTELAGDYNVYAVAYDRAGNSKKSNTVQITVIGSIKTLAVNDGRTMIIDNVGNLWSWGNNYYGQLGDGTTTNRTSPVQIKKGTKFTQVTAGSNHSLAIDEAGNLWTWGDNVYGQLGDGTTANKTSPVQIKQGTKFMQISAGFRYSLAIDEAGNLWTWGYNRNGQLGDGTTTNRTSPVQIKKGTKFTQISTGYNHSLAIDSNGNLWAWGNNENGQLGDGTTTDKTSPVQIKQGTKFTQVTAGDSHSLAIDESGNLWSWGYNGQGQLGDGTTTNRTSPVQIKQGTKFTQVSAGSNHSLALDESGNLWSWGDNGYGNLGSKLKNSKEYIQIQNKKVFTQISAGSLHSLALDSSGDLWSWGDNRFGQLGDGTLEKRTSPVQIKQGTKFKQIATNSENHGLAIDGDGNLWAWGNNENGQLGDGTTTNRTSPVQIKKGTKFTQISTGYNHSLAIDSNGNLWAWGNNENGQLGDGTTTDKTSPVQIKKGTKFTQVTAGDSHSLAIDSNGNLWAWGNNAYGQLGDGTTVNKTSPVQIKKGTKFTQVSAGNYHSLALDESGNLWAWGNNAYGQLGDGTTTNRTSPVQIKQGTKFTQISAGNTYNCSAIDSNGNLWKWGINNYGQLGDGTTTQRTSPVQVKQGTKFTKISNGFSHSLALDIEGKLYGTGNAECLGEPSLLMLEPEIMNY